MATKSAATLFLVISACVCATGGTLYLKHRQVDTGSLPALTADSLPNPGQRLVSGKSRVIVQYATPPGQFEVDFLAQMGAQVLGPVPLNGVMVTFPDDAVISMLSPAVVYIGKLLPEDKISSLVHDRGLLIVEFFPDVTTEEASEILDRSGVWEVPASAKLLPSHRLIWGGLAEAKALASWNETAYIFPAASADGIGTSPCVHGGISAAVKGRMGQYVASSASSWATAAATGATLGFFIEPPPPQLASQDIAATFQAALAEWKRYSLLDFKPAATSSDRRTLNLKFASGNHGDGYPFDGPGGVLAHAFYPAPFYEESLAGDLHLDLDEPWTAPDLYSVMLHEIGHALGLVHADDPASVMYPMYRRTAGLGSLDIAAIRSLYGVKPVEEESSQMDIGLEITDLFRNIADFPPGELIAIGGKAWGGNQLSIRWHYGTSGDWNAAPGAFSWIAPVVPIFANETDIVVEVSDGQGRTGQQTVHISR